MLVSTITLFMRKINYEEWLFGMLIETIVWALIVAGVINLI